MRRVARGILMLAAAGAALAPLRVHGHGNEFILARVTTPGDGWLHVELSADYAGNPMLASEAEARAALQNALVVRVGTQTHPLQKLAPLQFEKRAEFDPAAPLPRHAHDGTQSPQILAAVWSWRPTADAVNFEVPPGVSHSVVLWKFEPGQTAADARWAMLIAGDQSPSIAIAGRSTSAWMFGGLGAVALFAPVAWFRLTRRSRHLARASKATSSPELLRT